MFLVLTLLRVDFSGLTIRAQASKFVANENEWTKLLIGLLNHAKAKNWQIISVGGDGVLVQVSAHAWHSAQPPNDTSEYI